MLSDIVKRRSLRAFGRDENLARRAISSIKTQCASGMETFPGEHGVAMLVVLLLDRRGRRYDLEASWSF